MIYHILHPSSPLWLVTGTGPSPHQSQHPLPQCWLRLKVACGDPSPVSHSSAPQQDVKGFQRTFLGSTGCGTR